MSCDHLQAGLAFVLPFEGRGKASEHDLGGETFWFESGKVRRVRSFLRDPERQRFDGKIGEI